MNHAVRTFITTVITVFIGTLLFVGGFAAGHLTAQPGFVLPSIPGLPALGLPTAAGGTPASLQATFVPFWQAWTIVHQEYVDQPVKDTDLMQGAIRCMLNALGDAHTLYETPQEHQISDSTLTGQLDGIGAFVDKGQGGLLIVSTFAGSPAEAAGLKGGDLVGKVDTTDITTMDEVQAISLVRGPAGSKVHLTIIRKGSDQPLEFDVTRAQINVPSVESKMLPGNIAYVKINAFGTTTGSEVKSALSTLLKQQPHSLILDLRNNPGGYLDTAIEVASQFLPGGQVVLKVHYGDGHEQVYNATNGGSATTLPMVVLIDGGSASASEILAGAIQDNQRGSLLGVTSYGKGTVQQIHELSDNGGFIRVTIARWLTPLGRTIDKVGLTPNVTVPLTADDRAAGRDPQLDKAISILAGQSGVTPVATATAVPVTATP